MARRPRSSRARRAHPATSGFTDAEPRTMGGDRSRAHHAGGSIFTLGRPTDRARPAGRELARFLPTAVRRIGRGSAHHLRRPSCPLARHRAELGAPRRVVARPSAAASSTSLCPARPTRRGTWDLTATSASTMPCQISRPARRPTRSGFDNLFDMVAGRTRGCQLHLPWGRRHLHDWADALDLGPLTIRELLPADFVPAPTRSTSSRHASPSRSLRRVNRCTSSSNTTSEPATSASAT